MELTVEVLNHILDYLHQKQVLIQSELDSGNFSALRYIDKLSELKGYEEIYNFVLNILTELKSQQSQQSNEDWPNPQEVVDVDLDVNTNQTTQTENLTETGEQ